MPEMMSVENQRAHKKYFNRWLIAYACANPAFATELKTLQARSDYCGLRECVRSVYCRDLQDASAWDSVSHSLRYQKDVDHVMCRIRDGTWLVEGARACRAHTV